MDATRSLLPTLKIATIPHGKSVEFYEQNPMNKEKREDMVQELLCFFLKDSKYKHLPMSLLTRRVTIEPNENAEVIEDATTSTSTD